MDPAHRDTLLFLYIVICIKAERWLERQEQRERDRREEQVACVRVFPPSWLDDLCGCVYIQPGDT